MADLLPLIATERRSIADTLEGLEPAQWQTSSLCAGWSVRDLAAHLVMPFVVNKVQLAIGLARNRFDFDQFSDRWARTFNRPTTELVSTLRTNAEHRFTPPGEGFEFPLTDKLLHGLDIRRPLGIDRALPANAARTTLDFLLGKPATPVFTRKGAVDGLSFRATDLDWHSGSGPLVEGTADDLLLALTGRPVGFDGLSGTGAPEPRGRLRRP